MQRKYIAFLAVLLLTACASELAIREGKSMIASGNTEAGLRLLLKNQQAYPDDIELRTTTRRELDRYTNRLQQQGDTARANRDALAARQFYNLILSLDPVNTRAQQSIKLLNQSTQHDTWFTLAQGKVGTNPRDALNYLNLILQENPSYPGARKLKNEIEAAQTRETNTKAQVSPNLQKTISLEFRDQNLMSVFDVISRVAEVNFIFDRDVPANLNVTIFARNTTADDALNLLLKTNQLRRKTLNENTFLIYPARPEKDADYQDLVTRTFFLSNADPKQTLAMLRQMTKTRDIFIDERLNMLIMRDTPDVIKIAERLIAAQDLPQSEVMLEVEVLEVNRDHTLNLGINYPSSATVSPASTVKTIADFKTLNDANLLLSTAPTGITLNALHTDADTTVLANPKIRVKNRDKANIVIGERVPVITVTPATSTLAATQTVNYQDVGLTLNVEPTINLEEEVSVKISLEVSDIVSQLKTTDGALVYTIGTRKANTTLSIKDGETQMLAGLIKRADSNSANKIPGLGELPLLDRLFGSRETTRKNSEVVLLITPHIVRSLPLPEAHVTEFASGTDLQQTTEPFRLKVSTQLTVPPNNNNSNPVVQAAQPVYNGQSNGQNNGQTNGQVDSNPNNANPSNMQIPLQDTTTVPPQPVPPVVDPNQASNQPVQPPPQQEGLILPPNMDPPPPPYAQ